MTDDLWYSQDEDFFEADNGPDNVVFEMYASDGSWCSVCNKRIEGDNHSPSAHANDAAEEEYAKQVAAASDGMSTYVNVVSNDRLSHLALPNAPGTICGKVITDEEPATSTSLSCDICHTLAGEGSFLNEATPHIASDMPSELDWTMPADDEAPEYNISGEDLTQPNRIDDAAQRVIGKLANTPMDKLVELDKKLDLSLDDFSRIHALHVAALEHGAINETEAKEARKALGLQYNENESGWPEATPLEIKVAVTQLASELSELSKVAWGVHGPNDGGIEEEGNDDYDDWDLDDDDHSDDFDEGERFAKTATNWTRDGTSIENGFDVVSDQEASDIPFFDYQQFNVSSRHNCPDCKQSGWFATASSCEGCGELKCGNCMDSVGSFFGQCKKCAGAEPDFVYESAAEEAVNPKAQYLDYVINEEDSEPDNLFLPNDYNGLYDE